MHDQALHPETKAALVRLAEFVSQRGFYLAGGTGYALHLGHRLSQALDFFTPADFSPSELWTELRRIGECSPDYTDVQTWVGEFGGTKCGFFEYTYPLIGGLVPYAGVSVASPEDIACMKIEAIAVRGKKRDFIDLYFLLKEMGFYLEALLGLFHKKYASVPENSIHILKSLIFFADAESDPDPKMLVAYSWPGIKKKLADLVAAVSL